MIPRRIAVTGARGFLGSHLVRRAEGAGASVLAIGREACSGMVSSADILKDPSLLDGSDVFIHSAGIPSDLPVRETTKLAPRTLYSQTKIEAEKLVRELGRALALPFTIVRPSISYGQGDTNGMLDKLVAMIRSGRYLVVGSGDNVLHHTHVDDVVDATFALAVAPGARDDDFIVAGPETTTLRRLSEDVASRLGRKLLPVHVQLAAARALATCIDLARYRGLAFEQREPPLNHEKLDVMTLPIAFDTTKLRNVGFTPRIGYEEGLARTITNVDRSG